MGKEKDLAMLVSCIKQKNKIDLSSYRGSFLLRRLQARMNVFPFTEIKEYINLLYRSEEEREAFLKSLSINVSEFFRDISVFKYFREVCVREIIKKKELEGRRVIRFWSAGCSYGEEAYSLAIILKEELGEKIDKFIVRVMATDINKEALKVAKEGEYKVSSLKNLEKRILEKYFVPTNNPHCYRVREEIKEIVRFSEHNLLIDAPLKFMDVVFCRNVKIYFDTLQSEEVLLKLYNSLREGGFLVLGATEIMPFSLRELFSPLKGYYGIFKRNKGGGNG